MKEFKTMSYGDVLETLYYAKLRELHDYKKRLQGHPSNKLYEKMVRETQLQVDEIHEVRWRHEKENKGFE